VIIRKGIIQKINKQITIRSCPKKTSIVVENVQCGHFSDKGGILQMRTSVLFDAKIFGFFEIYDVSIRTRVGGDWASADIFRTGGRVL